MYKLKIFAFGLILIVLTFVLSSQQVTPVVGHEPAQFSDSSEGPTTSEDDISSSQQLEIFGPDVYDENQPNAIYDHQYFHIPGSVLIPRVSSTSKTYSTRGCVSINGGDPHLTAPVNIPTGSQLIGFRLFYKDNNPTAGLQGYVTYIEQGGISYRDLGKVESEDGIESGWADISHTVDNFRSSYVINLTFNSYSDLSVCGIRIMYKPPSIFGLGLPVIQN